MKALNLTFIVLFMSFASFAQETAIGEAPKIEFEQKLFDFGVISSMSIDVRLHDFDEKKINTISNQSSSIDSCTILISLFVNCQNLEYVVFNYQIPLLYLDGTKEL